jgi:hypothetical protein
MFFDDGDCHRDALQYFDPTGDHSDGVFSELF